MRTASKPAAEHLRGGGGWGRQMTQSIIHARVFFCFLLLSMASHHEQLPVCEIGIIGGTGVYGLQGMTNKREVDHPSSTVMS